jgi:hypothetical protein
MMVNMLLSSLNAPEGLIAVVDPGRYRQSGRGLSIPVTSDGTPDGLPSRP